ncbi:NUDIX hydrolase [Streptomyces sp. NPDC059788]|uniref:NUDIX hydrolase n=1 Tax=Streptomyces sp. NPDC059788 TaxID=3346948 RepID=UPI00365460FE
MAPPTPRCVRSGLLLNHRGEVLAVRTVGAPGGVYRLPGGDPGEDNADWLGLARTVHYETGLKAVVGRVLARDTNVTGPFPYSRYVHFCGRVPEHHKLTLSSVDHHRWVTADDLEEFFGPSAALVADALKALANGTVDAQTLAV